MTKLEREYAYGKESGLLEAARMMRDLSVMFFDQKQDALAIRFRDLFDELKTKAEKSRPPALKPKETPND